MKRTEEYKRLYWEGKLVCEQRITPASAFSDKLMLMRSYDKWKTSVIPIHHDFPCSYDSFINRSPFKDINGKWLWEGDRVSHSKDEGTLYISDLGAWCIKWDKEGVAWFIFTFVIDHYKELTRISGIGEYIMEDKRDYEALSRSIQSSEIIISTVRINDVPGFGAQWAKFWRVCPDKIEALKGTGASPQEAIDDLIAQTEHL